MAINLCSLSFDSHRNRFSRRFVHTRKKDSIDVIKFIGRTHSCLTGIMDDLNACYSFQVFSLHTFHSFCVIFHQTLMKWYGCTHLDIDHCWNYICINYAHVIQFISRCSTTKYHFLWPNFDSIFLGITLYMLHTNIDLHFKYVNERGKHMALRLRINLSFFEWVVYFYFFW